MQLQNCVAFYFMFMAFFPSRLQFHRMIHSSKLAKTVWGFKNGKFRSTNDINHSRCSLWFGTNHTKCQTYRILVSLTTTHQYMSHALSKPSWANFMVNRVSRNALAQSTIEVYYFLYFSLFLISFGIHSVLVSIVAETSSKRERERIGRRGKKLCKFSISRQISE